MGRKVLEFAECVEYTGMWEVSSEAQDADMLPAILDANHHVCQTITVDISHPDSHPNSYPASFSLHASSQHSTTHSSAFASSNSVKNIPCSGVNGI